MPSSLEELIKSQYSDGEVSSGSFTMDKEKALEKISKYQLPYPDAWVIKLAQGVVLSGSPYLKINQTSTETTFEFQPAQAWNIDLEESFVDPAAHSDPAWQAFRSALWAAGLNLQRPFKLDMQSASYFWNGFQLSRLVDGPMQATVFLSISHRTAEQGKGIPLIRNIQAARLNASLSKVFSGALFACPIKVSLDARIIDGFERCPGHGYSDKDLPIAMLWLPGEPALGVPPGSVNNGGQYLGHKDLAKICQSFHSKPTCHPARGAAILTAHAHYVSGEHGGWETPDGPSVLYWIKDGVVIQKEEFSFSKTPVSLALFACADHIKTDFSGFGLDERATLETLRSLVCQLNDLLPNLEPDLVLHDRDLYKKRLKIAGGLATAGLALKFVFPPALILTGAGAVGAIMLTQGIAQVDRALEKGYRKLLSNWAELVETLSAPGPSNS